MFLRLLSIEIRKLLKHPILWLEFASLVLIMAAYFAARYALMVTSIRNGLVNTRGLELDLQIGLGLFSFLSVLFYATTAALISAYDYPERGIQLWLARGVPHPLLLLARLAVTLLFGLVLVSLAVVTILGVATLARVVFLGGYTAKDLEWAQVLPAILRVFWASLPYQAMTILFGVISRSPLFAAGGTLVFRTVLENLLAGLADRFPTLINLLPSRLGLILQINTYQLDRTAKAITLDQHFLTEPQSILAIGTLFIFISGVSLVIFSHQDWGG
jgi:hypothetical protein